MLRVLVAQMLQPVVHVGVGCGAEREGCTARILIENQQAAQVRIRPAGDQTVSWVFEHSGLCEPISVRFSSDHGTVGAQFDPLTASVKEEIFDRDGQ